MATNPTVNLTEDAIRDLMFVASHSEEARQVEAATHDTAVPNTFPELFELISGKTSIPKPAVEQIVRLLVSLSRLKNETELASEQIFDLLTNAMDQKEKVDWQPAIREKWIAAKDVIVGLLSAVSGERAALALLQKASELTFAFQNILREARIITDIRPVFDNHTKTVERSVIIHKLLIDYSGGDMPKQIELAMDATDLRFLRKQCERAEEKAATIKSSLLQINWRPLVPRDEHKDQ